MDSNNNIKQEHVSTQRKILEDEGKIFLPLGRMGWDGGGGGGGGGSNYKLYSVINIFI